jgi:hypothetical protein
VAAHVPRKLSDVALTGFAVIALIVLLVLISPPLREQVEHVFMESAWDVPYGMLSNTLQSGFAIVHDFAGDNTYLFTFLIAACVFFVLMIKVIS